MLSPQKHGANSTESDQPIQTRESNLFQVAQTPSTVAEPKMKFPLQRNFWKYSRLCEEDFQKIADTGDILLFKTPEFGSQLQRFITNSNYNHIAVVLRSSTGALKFIEATIEYGVDIIDWDTFIAYNCYQSFERIVHRRLCGFERTKQRLIKLEEFIKVAKNKRYSLAATKLLRVHCTNDSDMNIKEDKTYFCSELVASIFKNLGLLPQDISASQYWPVSFSSRAGLRLQEGAYLDEEKLLEFESI